MLEQKTAMKTTLKYSLQIALAGVLALCPHLSTAQSATAAKADAALKDAAKKSVGKIAPSSPVDLNTASQADLEKIPGVGTPTAKKIIAARPYSSVADLSKAGISAKTIQAITPMVKVSAASAAAGAITTMSTPKATAPPPTPASTASTKPAATTSASSSNAAATSCGPGTVWVNTATKVFHRAGSKWYGKTKAGKCMTESDAVKAGYRESKEG
jgi:DNA uptake protein ComE-like DNA-binding protein